MATKKPQVGDPAVLDGQHLTVISVADERVKFGDEDAVKCAERTREIRDAAKAEGDALAKRWDAWKQAVATAAAMPTSSPAEADAKRRAESQNNATRARLALEEDAYRTDLSAKLDAVPRGARIGIQAADVVWMEGVRMVVAHAKDGFVTEDVEGAWSVPGRVSPDSVAGQGGRPVKVPKEHRRQDSITKAHRAEKLQRVVIAVVLIVAAVFDWLEGAAMLPFIVGASAVKFQDFVDQLCQGAHDLDGTDTLKCYLTNAAPSVSADAVKADLAEITAENGYTAGGEDTLNTGSETSGTFTVAGTDIVWTASGGTFGPFRYVVLYNDTHASDALILYWDYGSAITPAAGETFTVDFGASIATIA